MKKNTTYIIKGRKFKIERLVLGQVEQLQTEFGVKASEGSKVLTPEFLKEINGDIGKTCKLLAILCEEEGVELGEKNIEELTNLFKWNLDGKELGDFVQLFFQLSPGSSNKPHGNILPMKQGKKKDKKDLN